MPLAQKEKFMAHHFASNLRSGSADYVANPQKLRTLGRQNSYIDEKTKDVFKSLLEVMKQEEASGQVIEPRSSLDSPARGVFNTNEEENYNEDISMMNPSSNAKDATVGNILTGPIAGWKEYRDEEYTKVIPTAGSVDSEPTEESEQTESYYSSQGEVAPQPDVVPMSAMDDVSRQVMARLPADLRDVYLKIKAGDAAHAGPSVAPVQETAPVAAPVQQKKKKKKKKRSAAPSRVSAEYGADYDELERSVRKLVSSESTKRLVRKDSRKLILKEEEHPIFKDSLRSMTPPERQKHPAGATGGGGARSTRRRSKLGRNASFTAADAATLTRDISESRLAQPTLASALRVARTHQHQALREQDAEIEETVDVGKKAMKALLNSNSQSRPAQPSRLKASLAPEPSPKSGVESAFPTLYTMLGEMGARMDAKRQAFFEQQIIKYSQWLMEKMDSFDIENEAT